MRDRKEQEDGSVIPFLKWAGGKRWLTLVRDTIFPTEYGHYIEPFLGSGAIYFHLAPQAATLSDLNAELIDTYQAIRDDWRGVMNLLQVHQRNHSKSYYYKIRDQRCRSDASRAARFIYLNRTCWNGLYRVNLDGRFNVPIGTKVDVLLDTDNFQIIAKRLRSAKLRHSDFEPVIDTAHEGDLVFVDPPYTVKHNFNNFVKYNEKLFSWDDQIRLKNCLLRAKKRGARIVVANAFHESIKKLYPRLRGVHCPDAPKPHCGECVISKRMRGTHNKGLSYYEMIRLKRLLRRLPLFGGLADCRRRDHTEAFKEFAVNLVFSTAPIWLGGLIIFALSKSPHKTLYTSLLGTVESGELFMYSAAIVAPILYMAVKPERGSRTFPGQLSHIAFIAIIALISAAFFAIQRTGVWVDREFAVPFSILLYAFSLLLLYLAMVYRNNRLEGAPDLAREQTKEFVDEFNRRHSA